MGRLTQPLWYGVLSALSWRERRDARELAVRGHLRIDR